MQRPRITIRNLQKKVPIHPIRIKKAILKALSSEGRESAGEIAVYFVTDAKIKTINLKYLKHKGATDVIAFDLAGSWDKHRILADIIISTDTVIRNAKAFHTAAENELNLYIMHGLLHILGYDHKDKKDALAMRKKEALLTNL